MVISRLELFNFRNYRHLDLEFCPGRNMVVGDNAQGKTNLLEAIYLVSRLKSPRTPRPSDLIYHQEPAASVKAMVVEDGRKVVVKVILGSGGRSIEVNGRKEEKIQRVAGLLLCVLFTPEDLYLVRGEPSRRRFFLDETIESTGRVWQGETSRYRHLLRQRNALLKRWEGYGSRLDESLEPWDQGLSETGARIVKARLRVTAGVMEAVTGLFDHVTGGGDELSLRYQCSFPVREGELKESMLEKLRASREQEKRLRTTLVGPHRDEVEILIGKKEARYCASQGEQRAVACCLKFAQRKVIEGKTGRTPVLLLDDVLSELDRTRAGRVLELAGEGGQVILTSTGNPEGKETRGSQTFCVRNGEVFIEGTRGTG